MNNTAENQDTVEMGSDAEVLVVVSKVKNYIRAQSGFNTAGSVAPAISAIVRKLCDKAIENAKNDGRKTVMDRDFTALA
jgi:histone H3/H4